MTIKQIETLESYFKTENEHWNGFVFEMLGEVLEQGLFDAPEQPLNIFSNAIDYFLNNAESPLKAVKLFTDELKKLDGKQKLFLFEWVHKYLMNTEFEGKDLIEIAQLLQRHKTRLRNEQKPAQPMVKDIRESLKGIIQKEFEKLPETLQKLEPMQRLNIICKLAPFILPKVESVDSERGEYSTPSYFDFD